MSLEKKVRRFDRATLGKAIRLDNGFIRAPAKLARVGVLEYVGTNGKTWRELRLPEEVFSADSLDSFYLKPVVDDHPNVNRGVVDADNARALTAGTVGVTKRDGDFVVADLMLTDAAVIAKVESGKREISCGYFCDREPAPAGAKWKDPNTDELIPYDFIQRNITGNHVAIVAKGRAGPEVRISLDAGDAMQCDSQTQTGVQPQKANQMKFTIHGVDFEIDPAVVQAITAERQINADAMQAVKDSNAKLKADADKTSARADSADAKVATLTAELSSARDPKFLSAAITERVALENKAAPVLGADTKLDAMTNDQIKRAVVAKLNPALKLDEKSADYVQAAFDLVDVKAIETTNPITEAARKAIETATPNQDTRPVSVADAKKKFNQSIFATDAAASKPSRSF